MKRWPLRKVSVEIGTYLTAIDMENMADDVKALGRIDERSELH